MQGEKVSHNKTGHVMFVFWQACACHSLPHMLMFKYFALSLLQWCIIIDCTLNSHIPCGCNVMIVVCRCTTRFVKNLVLTDQCLWLCFLNRYSMAQTVPQSVANYIIRKGLYMHDYIYILSLTNHACNCSHHTIEKFCGYDNIIIKATFYCWNDSVVYSRLLEPPF